MELLTVKKAIQVATHVSARPSPARRITLAIAIFITAATVVAFQFASFKGHFDAHVEKHRVLHSLQELPSLHLHLNIKRNSMYVYGSSQANLFANPVVTADGVSYNGISTLIENDSTIHKFSLVDGVAYHEVESSTQNGTVTCLPPSDLPPVHEILSAINAATPVTGSIASGSVNCPAGKLFQITFASDDFLLCSALTSGDSGFKIFGADLDMEFTYMSSPITITKPTLSAEAAASCAKVPSSTAVISSTLSLLKGTANDFASRSLKAEGSEAAMASSTCACKGKKRACIFIPGLGLSTETGLQDSSTYFGEIQKNAPCCSSTKFANINTNAAGWTDATLQQKICDYSLKVSNTSNAVTKTIEDTIVVAHSLGNLVLSGAIANGRCKLSASSSWVAISAPMIGSMGSNYLQDACAGKVNGLVNSVAQLVGRCPANPAIQALAYQGDAYSSAALDAQYAAAQAVYKKSVSAALCSSGYNGLTSTAQIVFAFAGAVIPHKSSENDGIVEYQSCAKGLSTSLFGDSYTSQYYVTKLNHEDTTFRHGDALFNNAQKPVKWFECLL